MGDKFIQELHGDSLENFRRSGKADFQKGNIHKRNNY